MTKGRPDPVLTDSMRAEARTRPGQWLYSIDPGFDPDGEVPPHGIVGGWQIDHAGNVVRFLHNPNYRPSPMALGLPKPVNELENTLQLAATGYRGDEHLLAALLQGEVLVRAVPGQQTPVSIPADNGRRVLEVCTSAGYLPPEWPGAISLPGRQLADAKPGLDIRINPGSRVSVAVPIEDVQRAVAPGTRGQVSQ
ncbi:SseB family protein [Kitasatospora sp. RG8]|uniref:type VII secretion system-associated protein n=1 Tax=Kitasatospora sp. RG8 TaxID=2820815 RepID=UPI001AE0DC6B|nr:type VII secretion system-associated protein [Kitasatospora sp. RG8]MBP0451111.1 SseB family protein [Kitasatospora sp. RG8]